MQKEIVGHVLAAILGQARTQGGETDPGKHHPSQSYYGAFESFEDDFLLLAALIKHPSFSEETEWRLISPVYRNLKDDTILYRTSRGTLVPYRSFKLLEQPESSLSFDHIYVGPSAAIQMTMESVPNFLASRDVRVKRGVQNSMIPYRA